MELAIV